MANQYRHQATHIRISSSQAHLIRQSEKQHRHSEACHMRQIACANKTSKFWLGMLGDVKRMSVIRSYKSSEYQQSVAYHNDCSSPVLVQYASLAQSLFTDPMLFMPTCLRRVSRYPAIRQR